MNPTEMMKVDTLLTFILFDEHGVAKIEDATNKLLITKKDGILYFTQNGKEIARI